MPIYILLSRVAYNLIVFVLFSVGTCILGILNKQVSGGVSSRFSGRRILVRQVSGWRILVKGQMLLN